MSKPVVIQPGRLDQLAKGIFGGLLQMHGNPALQVAMKAMEPAIDECMVDALGPNSRAGKLAAKVVNASRPASPETTRTRAFLLRAPRGNHGRR